MSALVRGFDPLCTPYMGTELLGEHTTHIGVNGYGA